MRLVARFENQKQVNDAIDSLRNAGFDRDDMIISDLADGQKFSTTEISDDVTYIKTESDSLGEYENFTSLVEGLKGDEGITIAIKIPKREKDRVRSILEEAGAEEIVQD